MKIEYQIVKAQSLLTLHSLLNEAGAEKWEAIGGILLNNAYFHVLMARNVRD